VLAAMSPFSAATIPLRATHLPGYAPGRGLYVRSMLHVDAQAFTFSTDADGVRTATVDLVGLVYDSGGVQVDVVSAGFDVSLESAAAEQAFTHGIDYTALTRLKKAGGYQIRYAVRDRRSGAIGSTGGFVNVPDVAAGAFAISGIVLRAGQRPVLKTDPLRESPGVSYERLVPFAAGNLLECNIHVIEAGGSKSDPITHHGETVGYVIDGQLELTIETTAYNLSAGDSFFFKNHLTNSYRNTGQGAARVLWVNTPQVH